VVTSGSFSTDVDRGGTYRRLCPHCGLSFLERVRGRTHAACIELACPHCGTGVWAFSAPVGQGGGAPASADWVDAALGQAP